MVDLREDHPAIIDSPGAVRRFVDSEWLNRRMNRREVLKLVVLAGASTVAAACGVGAATATPKAASSAPSPASGQASSSAGLTKLTLSLASLPFSAAAAFGPIWIQQHKLLEKAGAQFGYDLTANWEGFPTGAPIVQGLAAGKLDIGPMGATPLNSMIDQGQAVAPISVAEGHLKFVVDVRKNSAIRNVTDLQGKPFAVVVGTDLYSMLTEMMLLKFGATDPAKVVKIVNVNTNTQTATLPSGTDAGVTIIGTFLQAADSVGSEGIVDSYGLTEAYYDGAQGTGAGHVLPYAKKSPYWPEGFWGHRAFYVARSDLVKAHPNAVAAFIVAQQQMLQQLGQMTPVQVASLNVSNWKVPADQASEIVKDDLTMRRGWPYITVGDAGIVYRQAQPLYKAGTLKKPISWATVEDYFTRASAIGQKAYEASGSIPSTTTFLNQTQDIRGLPNWDSSKWTEPS